MPGKSKLYTIILSVLLGISGILFLLFFFSEDGSEAQNSYISLMLNWCYALGFMAILALLGFAVRHMVSDFSAAKRSLIGVAVLLVIFAIGWALASGEATKVGSMDITETVSRRSEAGLIAFYILMGLAVVSIIGTEISKAFK